MIERKLLSAPLLYLSAFFEATKNDYYRHLYNVSSNGSWQDWLTYFLNGVATQATDVLDRVRRINDTLSHWRTLHKNIVFYDIFDLLTENPFITIKTAASKLNISFTAAQRALVALEKSGIVTETTGGLRGRVYCAKQLLGIIEEPTRIDGCA
jgi:Fic family protein